MLIYRINYIRMKVSRERGCKFNSGHPSRSDRSQKFRERRSPSKSLQTLLYLRAIAVYVLPYQLNLFKALFSKTFYLFNYVVCNPAFLTPPGKRHDAIGAKFITSFYDRNKRNMAGMSLET